MMLNAIRFFDFKAVKQRNMTVIKLPIDKIRPNPYQPRKNFDVFSLNELADSIKLYGVLQPISVRLINNCSYELVAGERRLRAAALAGLMEIPAILVSVDDNDSAVLALVENLQRQNLNFLEEAEGYQSLINDYGLTQEELARRVGKSQSTIANKLRTLKLAPDIRNVLIKNNLTERHARALIKIPDMEIQKEVLLNIIDNELNVKKTDELVSQTMEKIRSGDIGHKNHKIKRSFNDIRLFTNTIRQSVDIIRKSGVEATYDVKEQGEFYEINIKIHCKDKNAVQKEENKMNGEIISIAPLAL